MLKMLSRELWGVFECNSLPWSSFAHLPVIWTLEHACVILKYATWLCLQKALLFHYNRISSLLSTLIQSPHHGMGLKVCVKQCIQLFGYISYMPCMSCFCSNSSSSGHLEKLKCLVACPWSPNPRIVITARLYYLQKDRTQSLKLMG